jgi:hypothetical protein
MEYNIIKFQKEDVNLIIWSNFDYQNYTCKLVVKTDDQNNNNAIYYKTAVLTSTWNNGFCYLNNEILINFNLTFYDNDLNPTLNTKTVNSGEYNYQIIVSNSSADKVLLNGILIIKDNLTI